MKDEIVVGASAVTLAWGGKELVVKILGPTADYLGEGMKGLVQKGTKNLERIFLAAAAKAGDKLNEPGAVPPRVLQRVLQDGPFIEDELAAEYYGGILAASRSEDTFDDSGAYWLGVVQRLSLYQIKMHHISYAVLKAAYREEPVRKLTHVPNAFVTVEFKSLEAALGRTLNPTFVENMETGLQREVLVGQFHIHEQNFQINPTPAGVELCLWASGYRDKQVEDFFTDAVSFPFAEDLPAIKFKPGSFTGSGKSKEWLSSCNESVKGERY